MAAIGSCKTIDGRQGFSPTIYIGDSKSGSVYRGQEDEVISCKHKMFDEMFCMFDRDMQLLFESCLSKKEREDAWYNFSEQSPRRIEPVKPDKKDEKS